MSEQASRIDYTDPEIVRVMVETAEDTGVPLPTLIRRAELLSQYVEFIPGTDTPGTSE